MSWKTSTAFVSSEERIERIEKIKVVKGIQTTGAIAKYMSKHDFPPLAGLTEGGFAIDFYPIRDDIKRKMIIGNNGNSIESEFNRSEFLSDGKKSLIEVNGVIARGMGSGSKEKLRELGEKDKFIFWYNGIWNIIKITNVNKTGYIPIGLASNVIESTSALKSPYNPTDILSKLDKEKFPNTDYESVDSEKMAELMGMSNLYSIWLFDGIVNIMLNTHMKDGPYFLQRTYKKVDITLNANFIKGEKENYSDEIKISGIPIYAKYHDRIKEGFKKWANYYQNDATATFGDSGGVNVSILISEDRKLHRANITINNYCDKDSNVSHVSNVYCPNWKINNSIGEMAIYNHRKEKDKPFQNFTNEEYITEASHEFGHLMGLGDAYYEENGIQVNVKSKDILPEDIMSGYEIDIKEIDKNDFKKIVKKVTPNDMEMLFLAALKNDKQYFRTTSKGKVSEAISDGK